MVPRQLIEFQFPSQLSSRCHIFITCSLHVRFFLMTSSGYCLAHDILATFLSRVGHVVGGLHLAFRRIYVTFPSPFRRRAGAAAVTPPLPSTVCFVTCVLPHRRGHRGASSPGAVGASLPGVASSPGRFVTGVPHYLGASFRFVSRGASLRQPGSCRHRGSLRNQRHLRNSGYFRDRRALCHHEQLRHRGSLRHRGRFVTGGGFVTRGGFICVASWAVPAERHEHLRSGGQHQGPL